MSIGHIARDGNGALLHFSATELLVGQVERSRTAYINWSLVAYYGLRPDGAVSRVELVFIGGERMVIEESLEELLAALYPWMPT